MNRTQNALPLTLSLLAATWAAGCSDTVTPLGNLVPQIAVDPLVLDFGDVQIDTERELTLSVKNPEGTTALQFALSGTAPFDEAFEYAAAATDVQPNGTALVTVKFKPTEVGEKTAFLKVKATNSTTLPEIVVQLKGRGATAQLTVTPQAVSFGNVVLLTTKTIPVKVKNESAINADVLYEAGPNVKFCSNQQTQDPSRFCFSPTTRPLSAEGRYLLAPGEEATFNVSFTPSVLGREIGSFSFQACPACSKIVVNLDGVGIEQGFVCDPATLDFGLVNPQSCTTRAVVCTNQANETVTVVSWGALPGGTSSPDFTFERFGIATVLNEGDAVDIDVTYCPTNLGNDTGFLGIETDNPDPRRKFVSVSLAGNGGGPDIEVLPETLNFGQVSLIAPARRNVIVTNVGYAPLEISEIVSDAAGTGAFTAPSSGATIPVGGTLAITVEFQPTLEGGVMSELIIKSDDSDEPEKRVRLIGEGVNLPPCSFEVLPSALAFGVVERGRSVRRAFEVKNVGQNDCLVTGVRLVPEDTAPEFSLPDGDVTSLRIAAGASETFSVGYAPLGAVSHSGKVEFSISSPSNPYNQVLLSGTGADAVLLITPNDLDFGTIGIGCNARAREITIYNTGATTAQIDSIALASPGNPAFTVRGLPAPLPASPLRLSPGASATFQVGFRAELASSYAAAVELNGSFNGQPVSYIISMVGAGALDARQSDQFDQLGRPKADILFVIDNSGSMGEEQASLSANLGSFLQFAQAQQIDYQVAVTTTDVEGGEDGRFVPVTGNPSDRIVTPRTQPSPESVFAANISVGTSGSANEQGLQAAYLALSNPLIFGHNAGFIRPDAVLSVIIVSDEEDYSPGSVDFFINFFLSIKGFRNSNLFSLSGIVGEAMTGCNGAGGSADSGDRYVEALTRTGGVFQSICVSDWARALEDLSSTAFGFKSRFFLTNQPVFSSIVVHVDGVEIASASPAGTINWNWDSATNSVNFTPFATPEPGAHIQVDYTVECL